MPSEEGGRYAYLDSSAIVKLAVIEPETGNLEADIAHRDGLLTSRLGVTEVRRAARRVGGKRLIAHVDELLEAFVVVEMTPRMFDEAGAIGPALLRSLDALHLAAAASLDVPQLDFITYDTRLADAARRLGLRVVSPGGARRAR